MTAFAKLHVLLARDCALAVVIRHGTAKSVCTLLWDRRKDEFALGNGFEGGSTRRRATCRRTGSTLSTRRTATTLETNSWTVVSRPPYLKAVAYYPWRWVGGWFVNNRDYCVMNHGLSQADDREHPFVLRVEAEAPKPSLKLAPQ